MNTLSSIIISVAVVIMGAILAFITIRKPHAASIRKHRTFLLMTAAIAMSVGTIDASIVENIICDATSKGATAQQIASFTPEELKSYSKDSIAVSRNPAKAKPGDIIILTKYGCPDCASIKNDLLSYIKKNDVKNITFVSSQSDYGEKLVKHLNIQKVPCAIYVRHTALSNGADMTQTAIYASNEDGNTIFNENAFDHIVRLQKAKKIKKEERKMADEYGRIERIVWGTGYREDYCTDGSWNAAKQKVRDLLADETLVYIDHSLICEKGWENYVSDDWCWCFGYNAYAVPVKLALQCLDEYQKNYFSEFYLRDTLSWRTKNPQYFGTHASKARYLLYLDGDFGTDHCYD